MAKASDLILEYRQEGRETWAIRFYEDGLVREYSDSRMSFQDGKIVTQSRPLAWRKLARLSPAEMQKFLAALRKADFFSLPEQVGDPNRLKDGIQYVWKVNLAGQKKNVLAYGPEAAESPALKILGKVIQEVTSDAFDREGGDKRSDE